MVPSFQTLHEVRPLLWLPWIPSVLSYREVQALQVHQLVQGCPEIPFLPAVRELPLCLACQGCLGVQGSPAYPEVREVHALPSYQWILALRQVRMVQDLLGFQLLQAGQVVRRCLAVPDLPVCRQDPQGQPFLGYLFLPCCPQDQVFRADQGDPLDQQVLCGRELPWVLEPQENRQDPEVHSLLLAQVDRAFQGHPALLGNQTLHAFLQGPSFP